MDVSVLNAGNGACTVFRDGSDVMVADCGSSSRGRAVASAGMLHAELGADSEHISTVVVTHFDADHWKGLPEYPKQWAKAPSEITFYYPYLLPGDRGIVQMAYMILQAARADMPVTAALDIVTAWEGKDVTVIPEPLIRGRVFSAVGQQWTVHWPPHDWSGFQERTRTRMAEVANDIRRVAARDPWFDQALSQVQSRWWSLMDRSRADDRLPDAEQRVYECRGASLQGRDAVGRLRAGMTTREWGDFAGTVRSFNNILSVVHATDSFANFGDCEGAGLNALLNAQGGSGAQLAPDYRVILAPHHGTQAPGSTTMADFPDAVDALVSQNGQRHYTKGQRGEAKAFKDQVTKLYVADHRHTFTDGDITFTGL